MTYPPEPWHLGGSLLVSLFRVPVAALPASSDPLVLRGHAVVGVAFARYEPGGVLSYDELLVATPTLHRGRPRVTIPQIWVDSTQSLEGGRALWGIPKEIAAFGRAGTADAASVSASTDAGPVASLRSRAGRAVVPGMRQLALPIVQRDGGGAIVSHNRVIGRVRSLRTRWSFAAGGPLGYLHGRRPFASVAVTDATIVFGMDVRRPSTGSGNAP